MPDTPTIGLAERRKESWAKVTGAARYTADAPSVGVLHAALVVSPHAHARIDTIDLSKAKALPGVRALLTGQDVPVLCGEEIRDRPVLATTVTRYAGEPVALAVADTQAEALLAAQAVEVAYTPLTPVLSPLDAVQPEAPVLHPEMEGYVQVSPEIQPEIGTNVANRVRIRKGDAAAAFPECAASVSLHVSMPQSDHVAMETRLAQAEIFPDGRVVIDSATQAPYSVKALISDYFAVPCGLVTVRVPLVGGGYGGKASVQLELLAYVASRAVRGRAVRLWNPREQDFSTSPVKEGLEADIRLSATKDGRLLCMEATYLLDCGAYADSIPRVARAVAADCGGPYNIENISIDSLCVYTNHTYATAYRGFGHISATFAMERAMDELALALQMDALELRRINAIGPGHLSPTQSTITRSNAGDFSACLDRLSAMTDWPNRAFVRLDERRIRAMGLGCFWKAPSSKPDASSGVILTFNSDGSVNLHMAVVECGPGQRTALAQIVAQAMAMRPERVYVSPEFDTHTMPRHWKTVASMSTYMAGNAALRAAEDAKKQLQAIACTALHATPDELEVSDERVFLRADPTVYACFSDLVHGYKLPSGHTLGAQVIGRGGFTVQRITPLAPDTGIGSPNPMWTPGAQAVEIEVDTRDLTYRLLNAWTVIDAGKVINPLLARGAITGGMSMGLSLASREAFQYTPGGRLESGNLRSYKPIHLGEEARYHVEFVETPLLSAPYGARPISEHSILGMPAALANALSRALGIQLNTVPLLPQVLWQAKGGKA